ncbi:hypothetical protein [Photobacterium damselae]|uniref:hypothetical protein n=1 Tax=Photobacterium damselae TaxID=38293 RepID=UPI001F2A029A|nr:hypothetical protein [Photobacterium damselae]UKA04459.1 hypothetical protein IHC89_22820 [Photobacterium damselae subsp. damselae]
MKRQPNIIDINSLLSGKSDSEIKEWLLANATDYILIKKPEKIDSPEDIDSDEDILVHDGCDWHIDYVDIDVDDGCNFMANNTQPQAWMPLIKMTDDSDIDFS